MYMVHHYHSKHMLHHYHTKHMVHRYHTKHTGQSMSRNIHLQQTTCYKWTTNSYKSQI